MNLVMHNLGYFPFKLKLLLSLNGQMSFGTNDAPVNMPDWSLLTIPLNAPSWNNNYSINNTAILLDLLTKSINDYALTHASLNPTPKAEINWQAILNAQEGLSQSKKTKKTPKTKEEKLASAANTMETIGNISSLLSSILPENTTYRGSSGELARGLDLGYDAIASGVSQLGPVGTIVGGAMKVGGFLNKGMSALGLGTDGNGIDAVLNSNFLGLTPIGMINGIFGKRTKLFYRDNLAMALVGGAYAGSNTEFSEAEKKSNQKYGLFNSSARHRANDFIANAQKQLNDITTISENATNVLAQDGMANYYRYMLSLNGGPQAAMVAKRGLKLRAKKVCNRIHKKLKGGPIVPKPFEPVITLIEPEVTLIKLLLGGTFEPVITLDNPIKLLEGKKLPYNEWLKTVPKGRLSSNYDLEEAYNTLPIEELEGWRKASDLELKEGKYHLPTVNSNPVEGNLYFYKLGKLEDNPELQGEFDWYNSDDAKDFRTLYSPAQFDTSKNRYYYAPIKHKEGGNIKESKLNNLETEDKNVIPEGALHARKHNIANTDSLTLKGIPVVNDEGELQAEIERDEVILNLKLTTKLEELQKKYEESGKTELNKIAIEAGKLLVEELLHNTIDNTGLIDKCKKGGKINGPK